MNKKVTALLFLICPFAQGQVNMVTGGLELSMTLPKTGLQLTYNSRSLHRGLFGFGWCSPLDLELEISRGHPPVLRHCSVNLNALVEKTATGWMARAATVQAEFDRKGQIRMLEIDHRSFEFRHRTNGPLTEILSQSSNLVLTLDSGAQVVTQVITQVQNSKLKLNLKHRAMDLSEITGPSGTIWRGQYDDLDNLERWDDTEGQVQVEYDPFEDRVTQVTYQNGCRDQLTYIQDLRLKTERVSRRRSCPGEPTETLLVSANYSNKIHLIQKAWLDQPGARDDLPSENGISR